MATPAPTSGSKRPHSAAAERRVQPRHFHSGPNPTATNDDDGDGADTAAACPPSVVLYRHALESIFAFLRQKELAVALRVSREWLAAAHSMRSLQLAILLPKVPIYVLAQSVMGHHVASIGRLCAEAKLTAESLYVLAHKMPQLRGLVCSMSLPPAPLPIYFPAALRKLSIHVPELGPPADVNAALRTISRLPLLEELQLMMNLQPLGSQVDFAPLAAMPLLRSFDVRGSMIFSDAQADQLRALPRLQKVHVPLPTPLLRRMLRQPHDLQWQEIKLPYHFGDEFAALLPQLPSLTKIQGRTSCSQFDWMRGLPNLTDVNLAFDHQLPDSGRCASLVAGLQHCINIQILAFTFCLDLTAAHLADLLPRLPRLRELVLHGLDIDSLSFLSQPPLTTQLSSFHLEDCVELPLTELRHVHALRNLRALVLEDSFNERMDSHCETLYTPPSVVMPQLRVFFYLPPPGPGDNINPDEIEADEDDGEDEDEAEDDEIDDEAEDDDEEDDE